MKKVLVTGVTGYIGGYCARHLMERGYAVRGPVRDPSRADLAHLRRSADEQGVPFEAVRGDLMDDDGWGGALEGCDGVLHVASPVLARVPRDADELVRPAVDGTLRVLRAAADAGVGRVVVTSSIDAVRFGHGPSAGRVFTEDDWSVPDGLAPYPRSKTLAERAAWEFAASHGLSLTTIAPGLVLGPVLGPAPGPAPAGARRPDGGLVTSTSTDVVRLLLARAAPAVPQVAFSVVDVRDLADLHLRALESPAAAGRRYIGGGEHLWFGDIAALLAEHFGPHGYRVPTRALPTWLLRAGGWFDPAMRLVATMVGVPATVSSERARQELGWAGRPAAETVVETARSLVDHGLVPPPRPGRRR